MDDRRSLDAADASAGRGDDPDHRPVGGGEGGGGARDGMHRLAHEACLAIEGDDVDGLYAILNVAAATAGRGGIESRDGATTGGAAFGGEGGTDEDDDDDDDVAISNDIECRMILDVFLSLIGCCHHEGEKKKKCDRCELSSVPRSVRAHLLLRAMLRLPHEIYAIPW
jgi:hypothetical protein